MALVVLGFDQVVLAFCSQLYYFCCIRKRKSYCHQMCFWVGKCTNIRFRRGSANGSLAQRDPDLAGEGYSSYMPLSWINRPISIREREEKPTSRGVKGEARSMGREWPCPTSAKPPKYAPGSYMVASLIVRVLCVWLLTPAMLAHEFVVSEIRRYIQFSITYYNHDYTSLSN